VALFEVYAILNRQVSLNSTLRGLTKLDEVSINRIYKPKLRLRAFRYTERPDLNKLSFKEQILSIHHGSYPIPVPQGASETQLRELAKELSEMRIPTSTDQPLIHRIAMLMWIGEFQLAEVLWEQEKRRFEGDYILDLEDFLFRLFIFEQPIGGVSYRHPEFQHLVRYGLMSEGGALKQSTVPLSDLMKMDQPSFSSVDGLVDIRFDKREIERVAKIIPSEHHERLRLPLIFLDSWKFRYAEMSKRYKVMGYELENYLLQKLLNLTDLPFKKRHKIERIDWLESISTLRRRRFNTIHLVFPESNE